MRSFITKTDPLDEIKQLMSKFRFVQIEGLPRFCGGMVGYIGYDTVRFFEDIPDKNTDDLKLADILLVLSDSLIIFDHLNHKIKIIANAYIDKNTRVSIDRAYQGAIRRIDKLSDKLQSDIHIRPRKLLKFSSPGIKSNFTKTDFEKIVRKAKQYIRQGEIIQVVLSQRLKFRLRVDSFDIYRALRSINPSPYMYYLKFRDVCLVGSSPELLVRCEDATVQTRPIAGTRRRGRNEKEDQIFEKELLSDEKEKAEHIMLVDLGRNDLGRVCKKGTVRLSEFMNIERYSHVMHIVSNVTGQLLKGKDIYDVIRATFPAGTVSGAPKIRAMQIIDELENRKRGPYAGCIGYFSFSGNLDTCITIRTIVVKKDIAFIQVGAGIVIDSIARREYKETINKAKALICAVRLSEKNFL
jgi:anthranilate synthase component 1